MSVLPCVPLSVTVIPVMLHVRTCGLWSHSAEPFAGSHDKPPPFVEVLVVYREETNSLVLPPVLLPRYAARVKLTLSPFCALVKSAPYEGVNVLARSDLAAGGTWVALDDFQPKGAIPDMGVRGASTFFGIPFSPEVLTLVEQHLPALTSLTPAQPLVFYHGTGMEPFESICEHGLQETQGMLGQGAYVGTFWKACRFAARTQDYKIRDAGILLRCLVFPTASGFLEATSKDKQPCACAKCAAKEKTIHSIAVTKICDHQSTWRVHGWDGIHVPSHGIHDEHGTYKSVVTNEEWIVKKELVHCTAAMLLDMDSFTKTIYDPMERVQRVG